MCIDHPEVQALMGRVSDRTLVTYGTNAQADFCASNVRMDGAVTVFDVAIKDRTSDEVLELNGLRLAMPGHHNMLNALAAIAVAHRMGVSNDAIATGLAGFGGVKRRFSLAGNWNDVAIYDDYGHHPVEIAAVLQAARSASDGNVIAVVQPHRYTRLRDLFDEFCSCFNDADTVIVAPVYEAGEKPIDGINRDTMVQGLLDRGHRDARALENPAALPTLIAEIAKPGDMVLCLGAGNITQWANALPADLEKLGGSQ